MPENKFDLNKALQAAKLYNKIDYGNLNIPDVQQTMDNFENWRKSQGYKTEEEKKKRLEEEKKKALAKSSQIWADLGNSEDVYAWYNAHEPNPEKQAEFQRNGEMVAGIGSTIATLPFTAGMMGWVPAITTTATGAAGGYAGAYGGQKLGQYLDNKYGWNTTPYLSTIGGLAGGILGGGLGYKGLVRLGTNGRLVRGSIGKKFKDSALWGDVFKNDVDDKTIQLAIKNGKLKFAPESEFVGYHQSEIPLTKFKFPYNRWDVKTHGADPNVAFLTLDSPATSGFLSERPYVSTFRVRSTKPAIQSGEIHGMTKNGIRNKIVQWAKQNGADTLLLDGIADNRLQNQRILMAFDNSDIKFIGGPGKVKYFGPTMGKTTFVKTNNNYVDLDQLIKPLRKQIADKLGLKVSDPKVAKSPEYQNALKQLIEEFQTNSSNNGKVLMGSQKQLLNGDFVLDGEPMLPDFETFVARNQARNFRETPEQLRVWYDKILGLKPDIKIDNRYVSEILNE